MVDHGIRTVRDNDLCTDIFLSSRFLGEDVTSSGRDLLPRKRHELSEFSFDFVEAVVSAFDFESDGWFLRRRFSGRRFDNVRTLTE